MGKSEQKTNRFLQITYIYLLIYAVWRIFFTLPVGFDWLSMLVAVLFLVCELAGIIESMNNIRGTLKDYNPERPTIAPEQYPEVDVFIATHDEPEDLLYKTVNGCLHMEYPDKRKVHIYLCDDGNRPKIAELAKQMGVGYFTIEKNEHAKAGNLNNAIFQTHSPLIVTFDADMIPMSHFLMNNVPYFFLPEKIGFIQTPQSFYNTDLFQYNMFLEEKMPNEQDYFFRKVNIGRNRTNSPIYAGSNTIISREALEAIGGVVTGCITEDMATGIEIQKLGYKCYSVDEVGANGMAPIDVESLIKQRARWGRGCVQIMKKLKFLFGKGGQGLSFGAKCSYWSSFTYWFSYLSKFVFVIIPPLAAIFQLTIMKCDLWQVLFIYIPMYLLNVRSVYYVSGGSRDDKWNNITMMALCPYLIIPILKECVGIRENKFWITNKDRSQINTKNTRLMVPHIIMLILCCVGIVHMVCRIVQGEWIKYILVLFWTIRSIYDLLLSLLFMWGRANYRKTERLLISEAIEIHTNKKCLKLYTSDMSETGFSVKLKQPVFIEKGEELTVKIANGKYSSTMKAMVINVDKYADSWKYGFMISDISREDKAAYFQILFDRIPNLPQKIEKKMSYADDLISNINGRKRSDKCFKRCYPRCVIEQMVKDQKRSILVKNFNYEFVLVTMKGEPLDKVHLEISEDLIIEGTLEDCYMIDSEWMYLYKVCNKDALIESETVPQILEEIETQYVEKCKKIEREERKKRNLRLDELNDIDLVIKPLMIAAIFFVLGLMPNVVYGQEVLPVAGVYDWDDTLMVDITETDDAYTIAMQNTSLEKGGYGQAGFIFSEGWNSNQKELSFVIVNGQTDVFVAIGLLDVEGKIVWLERSDYLAYVYNETKEILYTDSDMFCVKGNTSGRLYVNLELFENTSTNIIGMVLGLVTYPNTSCELVVSEFSVCQSEEAIVPELSLMGIIGKDEIRAQSLGTKEYEYHTQDGWYFIEKSYSEQIFMHKDGTLILEAGLNPQEIEIVATDGQWIMQKKVSILENQNPLYAPQSLNEPYQEIKIWVQHMVPIVRIVLIVLTLILIGCYVVPRRKDKRGNK